MRGLPPRALRTTAGKMAGAIAGALIALAILAAFVDTLHESMRRGEALRRTQQQAFAAPALAPRTASAGRTAPVPGPQSSPVPNPVANPVPNPVANPLPNPVRNAVANAKAVVPAAAVPAVARR